MFSRSALGCVRLENQVFASSTLDCATAAPSFTTTATAVLDLPFHGAAPKTFSSSVQCLVSSFSTRRGVAHCFKIVVLTRRGRQQERSIRRRPVDRRQQLSEKHLVDVAAIGRALVRG